MVWQNYGLPYLLGTGNMAKVTERLKRLIKKFLYWFANRVDQHPRFKRRLTNVLKKSPFLYDRIQSQVIGRMSVSPIKKASSDFLTANTSCLSSRELAIFTDLVSDSTNQDRRVHL